MQLKGRKSKRCPRCNNICLISQVKCDECDLLFARIDKATNAAGKHRLKCKEKDQVVYVKKCPQDVKKWKLITITVCTGLFGGHYFYVGKWIKGLLMLVCFLAALLIGVVFNPYFLSIWGGNFYAFFGSVIGFYTLVWLNDIRRVCFNSFKIPVSILTEEEKKNILTKKEKRLKRKIFTQNAKKQKENDKKIKVEEKKEDLQNVIPFKKDEK